MTNDSKWRETMQLIIKLLFKKSGSNIETVHVSLSYILFEKMSLQYADFF